MKSLKIILWICAICCLLGFVGAALPLRATFGLWDSVGVQPPTADPITVFIFRLFLATVGLIGIFFVILARNPLQYGAMLLLAGYGLVCFGVFFFVGGIRYGLPVWIYFTKPVFYTVLGILVLIFRKKAMEANIV